MKVYPSKQFQKSFKKLPKDIQKAAAAKDQLFRTNPHSSQLKTHKLKVKLSNLWSYSVKYSYRNVIYQDIGTHEIYK
ncbi:hypothetical protein A3C59_00880 [Candidatus Daviesbacteria bacterium RIFCSPHIGHO2_02_FULL_36_13]|uniref:Uncharacterized protein n=1 Tax=Candidatus Daviesbacteria bacterium RIFCSPHIGHO2_02_FULL_36_13 TaxID=1797768 RepID=A0A1F5JRT4_9BACT|nr:MAG: hypothetical protein A3C59_00880 [Candidatus Daviesbacteria bacterium RIFCSPHIGHO2_02_FULL_36_13]OGE44179.1 MAG: hypothetical protein A3A45_01825 [Candidatus Daviesbacteria bacterium RIFCSPLOWO2_01_FULL_36_8]